MKAITVDKPWAEMSFWEKFTDKDSSRPEKTWRNRWFWTWPITIFGAETVKRDHPRIKKGTVETSYGTRPCLVIRTTKYKGEPFKNSHKFSHAFQVNWYGWFWGWKN